MEDILLIHKTANAYLNEPSLTSLIEKSLTWKTCLRQISFLHPSETPPNFATNLEFSRQSGIEILTSSEALVFLIEILCGLHSPIVGETQVFGQFKLFADQMIRQHQPLFHGENKWLQYIFHEVKEIRSQNLVGLGSQSYGSLLRKRIKSERSVAILGSGHLAKEIIPWLAPTKKVHVFARNPESISDFLKTYPAARTAKFEELLTAEALVIAAPISDDSILEMVNNGLHKHLTIYDLRGEANQLPARHPQTVSLKDLFAELDELRKESETRVNAAKKEIKQRVFRYSMRAECRPFGWDDLCA